MIRKILIALFGRPKDTPQQRAKDMKILVNSYKKTRYANTTSKTLETNRFD